MPATLSPHPPRERLRAFGLGRLDDSACAQIEEHLCECTECLETVEQSPPDSLVDLLHEASRETPSDSIASRPGLYSRLAAIIQPQAKKPTSPTPAPEMQSDTPAELRNHPRYVVLEHLGAGGMGTVWKARHQLMDRLVALKTLQPQLLNKPGALERFRLEVKAAAQLAHPNIVTAYDAETVGDTHFLVMEYVEGKTLARLVDERSFLPIGDACEYIRQAAVGLQHALERGMVHRDVKPQNLLVTGGQVKILDFGLARFRSETSGEGGSTQLGDFLGSPDYIAPEQARDARKADIRADIYSLGCTLYHLLAGQPPFPGGTTMEKVTAHLERMPPSLAKLRPDAPAELVRVVERMLAKSPGDRYQTPAQVAAALLPFSPSQKAIAPPRRTPLSPRLRAGILAAVLLLGLGVLSVVYGPAVYRFTTNQGVVVVETNDPDVEIIVKQGGEQITIIDTKTKRQVTLKAGTYEVELSEGKDGLKLSTSSFVLTRGGKEIVRVRQESPAVAATPESAPRPAAPTRALPYDLGKTELTNSLSVLLNRTVVVELKLTTQQQESIDAQSEPTERPQFRTIAEAPLKEILTPPQFGRFQQIQLQRAAAAQGPLAPLRFRIVVEQLALTELQKAKLTPLVSELGVLRMGHNETQHAKDQVNLDAILAAEQRDKLRQVFGTPLNFVTDSRTAPRPTRDTTSAPGPEFGTAEVILAGGMLSFWARSTDELRPSAEQKAKIDAIVPQPTRSTPFAREKLAEILSPAQLKRFEQVQMHQATTARGPLNLFRYRVVVESLRLNEEQRKQLKHLYDLVKDTRGPGWSANTAGDQAKIDAILTAEQRQTLADLLGPAWRISTINSTTARETEVEAHGRKAQELSQQRKYTEAIAECTAALRLDPRYGKAYRLRGSAYSLLKEHEKAVADLTLAIQHEVGEGKADAYAMRSYAYLNKRAFEACIADGNEALRMGMSKDRAATARVNRGWAFASQGDYVRAFADADEAVRLNPKYAIAYYFRGHCHQRLLDAEKAKADQAKARELDPEIEQRWGYMVGYLTMPAPLHFWLRGRHVLTVAQNGQGQFTTITAALKAIKPGEVIKVLDKGPYREALWMDHPVSDIGLVSDVGTVIEIPDWRRFAGDLKQPAKLDFCKGMVLQSLDGIRLSGLRFIAPPTPADANWSLMLDLAASGEVAIEHCEFLRRATPEQPPSAEPDGRNYALTLSWVDPKASSQGRFLLRNNMLDGGLIFNFNWSARLTVKENMIRSGSNAITLPNRIGEISVRDNVLRSFNGIVLQQRVHAEDPPSHALPCLIANNLIDVVNCPLFAGGPSADPKLKQPLSRAVRIQNNIMRSQRGTGIEVHADDHALALEHWQLAPNCYSSAPKSLPANFPTIGQRPGDIIQANQFSSLEPGNLLYLRIAADGPLATAGVGEDLPRHLGPFPPGPPPAEGDWFTRLLRPR